jgi:hypothetical protein
MAKKKGRRALLNLLRKFSPDSWTKGTLTTTDFLDGHRLYCNVGFIASQIARAPVRSEPEAFGLIQRVFDVDSELYNQLERINDSSDTFEENMEGIEGLLGKREPLEVIEAKRSAKRHGRTIKVLPGSSSSIRCSSYTCTTCYEVI